MLLPLLLISPTDVGARFVWLTVSNCSQLLIRLIKTATLPDLLGMLKLPYPDVFLFFYFFIITLVLIKHPYHDHLFAISSKSEASWPRADSMMEHLQPQLITTTLYFVKHGINCSRRFSALCAEGGGSTGRGAGGQTNRV